MTTLIEMNHLQPPNSIKVDNYTAVGISNESIKQRMSKSMYMWLYWIQCRIKQDQFIVYWKSEKDNLGDQPTKHHSPAHIIMIRPVYLYDPKGSTVTLQGCVNYYISAHTECVLSLSFGHKTHTTPVLSPLYGNSARTTCMLSPPFGHITIPVERYVIWST